MVMASPPLVEDLDAPPVVGQSYDVPAVWLHDEWLPMLGHPHVDTWLPDLCHTHFDPRFLTDAQLRVFAVLGGTHRFNPFWKIIALDQCRVMSLDAKTHHPERRVMQCTSAHLPWKLGPNTEAVRATGSAEHRALWKGGKPHCPHQGICLSQFWDGESATVECPMHGLTIHMRPANGPNAPVSTAARDRRATVFLSLPNREGSE